MIGHQDTLYILAELSIALAGFTGIVTALGRRAERRWEPDERARLESLLWAAGGGVVASLAPPIAASSGMAEATVWRLGNGVFALAHLVGGAWFYTRWRLSWRDSTDHPLLRVSAPFVAIALGGLVVGQLAVALGFLQPLAPFFYLSMLLWGLIVGLVQFVILLVGTIAN